MSINAQPGADRAHLADVDIAIVMESTYPYLRGGVSAVVHDIVTANPNLTYGIIHITWDSESPHEDLYGIPDNVIWVAPIYLAMTEHRDDFMAGAATVKGGARYRTQLCHRVIDALEAIAMGDTDQAWALYDEGLNPRTRTFALWGLLGTKEWMVTSRERWPELRLSLVDTFWLMREFFSLMYAVLTVDVPRAKVYHAHTTGYAAWLAAAAARQNATRFLLTEHNLYVRDTINTMLDRHMSLPMTADWHALEADPTQRAWMAWWTGMALMSYPMADVITFLYPKVFSEAAGMGAPVEKGIVLPNGVRLTDFAAAYNAREQAVLAIQEVVAGGGEHTWRLALIARVVPIKGIADMIESVRILVARGISNFHIDVLGPTEHVPAYYHHCLDLINDLGLASYFTFCGTVDVKAALQEYDLLLLPSHNEGQPVVVLEAMAAGLPTLGTVVGGMEQLVVDDLSAEGKHWAACGSLVEPGDTEGMAVQMQTVMRDLDTYLFWSRNARGRVVDFFQLEDSMAGYERLHRQLMAKERGVPSASASVVIDLRQPLDLTHETRRRSH